MDYDRHIQAPSPADAPAVSSRVALVVDHEPLIRELLRSVLSRQGWNVIDAATPAESLSRLDGHRPALLVIDPTPAAGIDGDLVARVRSRDPDASIVVVSDHPLAESMARALGARFMPKPFAIRDFVTFVASTKATGIPPGSSIDADHQHRASIAPRTDIRATAEALDAWRAAERRLKAAPPGSPERSQLEIAAERCRVLYRWIVEQGQTAVDPPRARSASADRFDD